MKVVAAFLAAFAICGHSFKQFENQRSRLFTLSESKHSSEINIEFLKLSSEPNSYQLQHIFASLIPNKSERVSAGKIKKWSVLRDVIKSHVLSQGDIDDTLNEINAAKRKEYDLKQLSRFILALQMKIKSKLKRSATSSGRSSRRSGLYPSISQQVLQLYEPETATFSTSVYDIASGGSVVINDESLESSEVLPDSSGDGEDDDVAPLVFESLRQSGDPIGKLPLKRFLQWGEVQELLSCGALTKEQLATAIESCGIQGEDLDQIQFSDLVNTVDDYVNPQNLPFGTNNVVVEKKVHVNSPSDVSAVMTLIDELMASSQSGLGSDGSINGVQLSYHSNGQVANGEAAVTQMATDFRAREERRRNDEIEVEEMFMDISKGKDFITAKALKAWDELQELYEAEFASEEVISRYLETVMQRRAALGKKSTELDLEAFREFMGMLDMVLLDEELEQR